ADRLGDVRLVRLEVVFGDESAVGAEVGRDRVSDLAAVENIWTARGQSLQRVREVGLDHELADLVQPPIVRVRGLRRRRDLDSLRVRDHIRALVRYPKTVHEPADME